MKKKIMASLLVGSAVVGASLAPLSAQAVTTGNTPVSVGIGGGALPDHGSDVIEVDPDPNAPNTDFDLLAIPKSLNFSPVKIGDDLSAIKLLPGERGRSVMVGDLRGTKEGWHVTGEISGMTNPNSTEQLEGSIRLVPRTVYARYIISSGTGLYITETSQNGIDIANNPVAPVSNEANLKLGGGASTLMSASIGKGQGTWAANLMDVDLNVTTPTQELKKGAYIGYITWNLVAGPSI
ncbi:WxL domain-containing protein [Enterococcus faecalis]|uniref:WxL domain-containing protein n=1 Tax=Enterococcus TaxID=1350 RepID=UPI0020900929|nr:WxL domain-containing protein [Enterococcus faecalis]MCO5447739.1 WxL domain-containing protein [Enterococcus faecalis]MEB6069752.1 WxL domain-containing protein [Enterococcus faecalis]MEB6189123.1 WxL domain-containing protein [Enterococcus faecalis]